MFSKRFTSGSGRAMMRLVILRAISSVLGRKGRSKTRERSGVKVGPMRWAWTLFPFIKEEREDFRRSPLLKAASFDIGSTLVCGRRKANVHSERRVIQGASL